MFENIASSLKIIFASEKAEREQREEDERQRAERSKVVVFLPFGRCGAPGDDEDENFQITIKVDKRTIFQLILAITDARYLADNAMATCRDSVI
jgi:hypothetical protein